MEPRKGTHGLLGAIAKAASARAPLALAVAAALAVSGCGGDSDSETASSSRPTAESGAAQRSASAAQSTPSKGPSSGQGQGSGAVSGSPGQGQAAGGGQGTPISPPQAGGRERGPTPQEEAEATIADISLTSPAVDASGSLPSAYTCEGKDSWPTLQWRGVPAGTEELILFVMNSQPLEGKLFFDWALAGIDPGLGEIEAGTLPRGTVSGRNSFGQLGYSICPAQGQPETYVFALFALPERLPVSQGFDPRELRLRVLDASGNVGLLAASYAR